MTNQPENRRSRKQNYPVNDGIGKQVKRFWPAHFFVLFYTIHLAVLGILVG